MLYFDCDIIYMIMISIDDTPIVPLGLAWPSALWSSAPWFHGPLFPWPSMVLSRYDHLVLLFRMLRTYVPWPFYVFSPWPRGPLGVVYLSDHLGAICRRLAHPLVLTISRPLYQARSKRLAPWVPSKPTTPILNGWTWWSKTRIDNLIDILKEFPN